MYQDVSLIASAMTETTWSHYGSVTDVTDHATPRGADQVQSLRHAYVIEMRSSKETLRRRRAVIASRDNTFASEHDCLLTFVRDVDKAFASLDVADKDRRL